jgi:hypothetical protein
MIWSNVNLLLSDFEQFQIWTIFKFEHIWIWTDFQSWTNSNFEQIFESEQILVLNRIWIWTNFEWNRFWMERILNGTDFEWNRFGIWTDFQISDFKIVQILKIIQLLENLISKKYSEFKSCSFFNKTETKNFKTKKKQKTKKMRWLLVGRAASKFSVERGCASVRNRRKTRQIGNGVLTS